MKDNSKMKVDVKAIMKKIPNGAIGFDLKRGEEVILKYRKKKV